MCLACARGHGAHGKEQIRELFSINPFEGMTVKQMIEISTVTGNMLNTHDNRKIELTKEQVDEICDHALVVIATGVDTRIDVWAIQWPIEYTVKTF